MRFIASLLLLISANVFPCSLIKPPKELGVVDNWKEVLKANGDKFKTWVWAEAVLLDNLVHDEKHYAIFDLKRPSDNSDATYTRNILVVCDESAETWKPVAFPSTPPVPGREAFTNPPRFEYLGQVRSFDDQETLMVVGGRFWGIYDVRTNPNWKTVGPESTNEPKLKYFFTLGSDQVLGKMEGAEMDESLLHSGIEMFTLKGTTYVSFLSHLRHEDYKPMYLFSLERSTGKWTEVAVTGPTGEIVDHLDVAGHLLITNNGTRVTFRGNFVVNENRQELVKQQTWYFFGDRWSVASN